MPEELTMKGQFKELLQTYCTSRIRARSPEELNIGKPWTENDLTYFTIKGLQEFLKQRGFNHYTRPQLQQRLRDLNGGQNCHGVYKLKDEETGKWSNIRVWWVPEFHEEEVELPIEESSDESDIPSEDGELLTLTDIVEWIKVLSLPSIDGWTKASFQDL